MAYPPASRIEIQGGFACRGDLGANIATCIGHLNGEVVVQGVVGSRVGDPLSALRDRVIDGARVFLKGAH